MCGLIGAIGVELRTADWQPDLLRRGRDHLSRFQHGELTVLHSRLAIVARNDPTSNQPLRQDGLTLLCNGFIGNAAEVYRKLGAAPVASDCGAVLAAYVAAGAGGLGGLRGQFAAAVVDTVADELVLLRDATGICPLYYAEVPGGLIFGSQASWVARAVGEATGSGATDIDPDAAAEFRALGYVVGPRTLRPSVRQVPPGSALRFDLDTGAARGSTRWGGDATTGRDVGDLAPSLIRSVARNLGGDVAPWLLLSGGLDSLLVLHCAAEAGARPTAVVLGYPDGSNADEVARATEAARWYGVPLHIVEGEPPDTVITPARLHGRVDWPYDGGSLAPKLTMADFIAGRGGRVVLGGTGADELFAGYSRHQQRLGIVPAGRSRANDGDERRFFRDRIAVGPGGAAAWEMFMLTGRSYGDAAFAYDLLELSMLHNVRVDSCFANTALEYRPVFQDLDVVSIAAGLTIHEKSTPGVPKAVLRAAFRGAVRADYLDVPKRPLRYGRMGPTASWRSDVFRAWREAQDYEVPTR